ncbi:MAG: hypothetical protein H0V88_07440 [Pyrinomonadaceae bacterium]|nr:hypothetical protein [Pyrinomonadaceae bacterium]
MPRVVKFTFCAAATLMLLAMAACSYDHYGSWSNTSGAAEPPEYSLTCGGYSEMNELEMLGVALGFFAVPIFFAGWLLWYREVQLETVHLTILLRKENLPVKRVDVAHRNEELSAKTSKRDENIMQFYDARGLTPLERVIIE